MTLIKVFLFFTLICGTVNGHANTHGEMWTKSNDTHAYFSASYIGEFWTMDSLLQCIVKSSALCEHCHGVIFNEEHKVCAPGLWIIKDIPRANVPSNPGLQVFARRSAVCDMSFGFGLAVINRNIEDHCMYISDTKMNYTSAKQECESKDGSLYAPKRKQRFDILRNSINESVWIGLEDIYKNGTFYWVDGESFLYDEHELWHTNQPDGPSSGQFCGVISGSTKKIHDTSCRFDHLYACEKQLDTS